MILFGAGASIPFNIPTMGGFTEEFEGNIEGTECEALISKIKAGIENSKNTVGKEITFDLESLLAVLTDLENGSDRIITIPTASVLIKNANTAKEFRTEHSKESEICVKRLKQYIFSRCMNPIIRAKKDGDYSTLNNFLGPLMTILNNGSLASLMSPIQNIFTTNWDLCFKNWAVYHGYKLHDFTRVDDGSNPIFDINTQNTTQGKGFVYTPLHGSIDLFKEPMHRLGGKTTEIIKNALPEKIGPDEDLGNLFIIYPLEISGYAESVQSPYLDMLFQFKQSIARENIVYVIGSSLRDITISSILEETVKEKIRLGQLNTLDDNLETRKKEGYKNRFKLIIFTRDEEQLKQRLFERGNTAISASFLPVECSFPIVGDEDYKQKMATIFQIIHDTLVKYKTISKIASLFELLIDQYNLNLAR